MSFPNLLFFFLSLSLGLPSLHHKRHLILLTLPGAKEISCYQKWSRDLWRSGTCVFPFCLKKREVTTGEGTQPLEIVGKYGCEELPTIHVAEVL